MNTITQSDIELSERLRKACLEKGITEPRFVAQDEDGWWIHYDKRPVCYYRSGFFSSMPDESVDLFRDERNENWRDTLMKFIKPIIQAGKRYYRRDGNITCVMRAQKTPDYFTDGVRSWHANGIYFPYETHNFDLIAEYTGKPLADILQNTCEHCGKKL